jgi:hypothetical protein
MRILSVAFAAGILVGTASAQTKLDGPTDEKAKKTYKQALQELHNGNRNTRSTISRRPTSRTADTAPPVKLRC